MITVNLIITPKKLLNHYLWYFCGGHINLYHFMCVYKCTYHICLYVHVYFTKKNHYQHMSFQEALVEKLQHIVN